MSHAYLSIHNHDYLELAGFLERLEKEGPGNLAPEKTAFVFLADEIISMPYQAYCMTLKEFERCVSVDQYYNLMHERGILDRAYHEVLLARMFENDVLY